jgi:hypothetical protein
LNQPRPDGRAAGATRDEDGSDRHVFARDDRSIEPRCHASLARRSPWAKTAEPWLSGRLASNQRCDGFAFFASLRFSSAMALRLCASALIFCDVFVKSSCLPASPKDYAVTSRVFAVATGWAGESVSSVKSVSNLRCAMALRVFAPFASLRFSFAMSLRLCASASLR